MYQRNIHSSPYPRLDDANHPQMNGAKKQNAEILLQSWGDSRWKCHFRKMYVKDVAIRFEYKTKSGSIGSSPMYVKD